MSAVKHPMTEDPFDIFDADDAPELAVAPPALGRPAASLHPLVRSFVDEHLPAVGAALRERGDDRLAALLEASAQAATAASAAQCKTHAAEASDLGWETLQRSGAWPSGAWREAFVLTQLLLCWCDAEAEDLPSALRRLDMALILGGPSALVANAMQMLDPPTAEEEEVVAVEGAGAEAHVGADAATLVPVPAEDEPIVSHPIETSGPVSADEFGRRWWRQNKPVVVRGAMAGWRALRRWPDLAWLRRAYGERLVPVELGNLGAKLSRGHAAKAAAAEGEGGSGGGGGGGSGGDSGASGASGGSGGGADGADGAVWGERLMRISELVDSRLIPDAAARQQRNSCAAGGAAGVAYLAQHPLFEQLPRLRADFAVPRLGSPSF